MDEKTSILIIDGDDNTCGNLAQVFRRKGYEIEVVATGRGAIEQVVSRFYNVALTGGDVRHKKILGVGPQTYWYYWSDTRPFSLKVASIPSTTFFSESFTEQDNFYILQLALTL